MTTFQINLFKGHPIIEDGENTILIDTGAPSTIHNTNDLYFCTDNYSCVTNYMGLTVQKLSEMFGMEVTTLIGVDILSNYNVLFDYQNGIVSFNKDEIKSFENVASITSFMGIPIIELTVDKQKLKFFLDTGAKLSYLDKEFTTKYDSIGTEDDFYPGVGQFETDTYEILTGFGNKEFKVRYGNLPTLLQMTLMLGGTNGIIGFDFFNNFKINLDIRKGKLKYE